MNSIPCELLVLLFQFCDQRTLKSISCTNKTNKEIIEKYVYPYLSIVKIKITPVKQISDHQENVLKTIYYYVFGDKYIAQFLPDGDYKSQMSFYCCKHQKLGTYYYIHYDTIIIRSVHKIQLLIFKFGHRCCLIKTVTGPNQYYNQKYYLIYNSITGMMIEYEINNDKHLELFRYKLKRNINGGQFHIWFEVKSIKPFNGSGFHVNVLQYMAIPWGIDSDGTIIEFTGYYRKIVNDVIIVGERKREDNWIVLENDPLTVDPLIEVNVNKSELDSDINKCLIFIEKL